MDRLVRLLAESIDAVTQRQKNINQAVTERLIPPSVKVEQPIAQASGEEGGTKTQQNLRNFIRLTVEIGPPSQQEGPMIMVHSPFPRRRPNKQSAKVMDFAVRMMQQQHRKLIDDLKSLAIEAKLSQIKQSESAEQAPSPIPQSNATSKVPSANSSPKERAIKKTTVHRRKESPKKEDNEQLKLHNMELLKEAQRKRLELMDKLRKLDHKVEQIKKTELSNSRVGNGDQQHNNYHRSISNGKSERQRHQQAMRLIKKINDEKRERQQRKIKELERSRIEKQAQLEAMLVSKEQEQINRKLKLARQPRGPYLNTLASVGGNLHRGNSQSVGGLDTIEKANILPDLMVRLKRNETLIDPKKGIDRLDVNVTIDPTKRSFPKSKIHKLILQEQRDYKSRQLRDRTIKMQQLQRRNNYATGKNKVVLTPISLSSSVSEQRSDGLHQRAAKMETGKNSNNSVGPLSLGEESQSVNREQDGDSPKRSELEHLNQQETIRIKEEQPAAPAH